MKACRLTTIGDTMQSEADRLLAWAREEIEAERADPPYEVHYRKRVPE